LRVEQEADNGQKREHHDRTRPHMHVGDECNPRQGQTRHNPQGLAGEDREERTSWKLWQSFKRISGVNSCHLTLSLASSIPGQTGIRVADVDWGSVHRGPEKYLALSSSERCRARVHDVKRVDRVLDCSREVDGRPA
jgi:hypothetical protein